VVNPPDNNNPPDNPPPPPPPHVPGAAVRYSAGQLHSPITEYVAANLKAIAAQGPSRKKNGFLKIADANGASSDFMKCFAQSPSYNLASHSALQATLNHFAAGSVGGVAPYLRDSKATGESFSALNLHEGNPTPLAQELSQNDGAFALVMFGTSDISHGGTPQLNVYDEFKANMFGPPLLKIIDQLIAAGVVPILTTAPNYTVGEQPATATVLLNVIARAVAQGRQIPLVDLHKALEGADNYGMVDESNHINVLNPGSGARCVYPDPQLPACNFTDNALHCGYNMWNLLSLQALDRVKKVVADDAASLDDSAPATMTGDGTGVSPFEMDALPFTDLRNLSQASPALLKDASSGCGLTPSGVSSRHYIYHLQVSSSTKVHAVAIDREGSSVDASIYHFEGDLTHCRQKTSTVIAKTLAPGHHYFAVNNSGTGGGSGPPEFLFAVFRDP
jgi:hypothetical protein